MIKKAFVTLLSTKNYLKAVLILNKSIKENKSSYPLVCGVTEDIFTQDIVKPLLDSGVIVEKIETLSYSEGTLDKWKGRSVLNTASKLSLFDLKNYDKLCYIDADTFLLDNIDEVLDRLDGSMISQNPGQALDDYGFTGLFVFQPKYHRNDFYKHLMQNFNVADGDLLGSLWFFTRTSPCHQIPYIYCMHYTYAVCNKLFPKSNERELSCMPKVIHFCNEDKPWLNPEKFPLTDPIIKLYFSYMNSINI